MTLPPAAALKPAAWAGLLLACVLAAGMALGLAALSTGLAVAAVVALAALVLVAWTREPRRALVVALFVLAPLDVSKAVVAPLGAYYSPGLYVSPAHMMVLLLGALWLAQRLLVERRGLPFSRLDAGAATLLALIWLSALRSPQGLLAVATAVTYTLAVGAFYVTSHALKDRTDIRLAVTASVAMLALEALHVAAQMATHQLLPLPGSKSLVPAAALMFGAGGTSFLRPTGFQGHPNALGHHMVILLPPALALVLLGRRFLAWRTWLLAWAALGASAVLLLLTLSRGGWASGALGALLVVVVFAARGVLKRRQIAGFVLAAATALAVLVAAYPQAVLRLTTSDGRSVEARVLLTDQAVTMIRANPLTGVGYGAYNRAAYAYVGPRFATVSADFQEQVRKLVVHNGYLLLAAELGLPAMLLFIGLMIGFVRLPWTLPGGLGAWRDPGAWALAVGLSGSMIGQMLYWSSDNYYADARVFMMWLSAGLLRALVAVQGRAAPQAGPVPAPGPVEVPA